MIATLERREYRDIHPSAETHNPVKARILILLDEYGPPALIVDHSSDRSRRHCHPTANASTRVPVSYRARAAWNKIYGRACARVNKRSGLSHRLRSPDDKRPPPGSLQRPDIAEKPPSVGASQITVGV